jgi:hypothetical protein
MLKANAQGKNAKANLKKTAEVEKAKVEKTKSAWLLGNK